jgi:PAS domain S-box-containing protein
MERNDSNKTLRQKAEELLKKKSSGTASFLSEIETLKLIHELEVHQIELEMQNEELSLAKERAAELATEKYIELYDFAPSGYFTLSKEGEIIELNLSGASMLGKERDLLKNSRFGFFVSKDTRPILNLFLEKVFSSKVKETCELTLQTSTNLPLFVHLTGIVNQHGDQCMATVVDITGLKRAEQELIIAELHKRALDRLNKIASRVPGVVYQYRLRPDGSSCFPFASEAIREIYRVTPDEVRDDASAVFTNLHPEYLASVADTIQASAKDLTPWQHEYRVKFSDGTIRSLYGNALPQREADGSVLWHGFITDITERKQMEDELKLASSRLFLATRAGGIGTWDYDINNNILAWDDRMYDLYGIEKKDFAGLYDSWKTRIHPDDLQRSNDEYNKALRGEKEYDTEFRVVWPDSSIHYIRALAVVQRDDSGKALRMIGTNWDISELRNAENEKLEDSESRYRSIFNGSPDGIMVVDEQTKMIIYANSSQCLLLGYAEEELKTMTIAGIHPADTFPDAIAMFESISRGEKTIAGNIQCVKKNREIFYVDIAASFLTINGRKCIVGFFRDITQHRDAEEELKNKASLLTNLIINLHEGVLLEDSTRKILITNQLFCDMFGIPVPPEALLGADCSNAAEESKMFFKNPDKFIADIKLILAKKQAVLNDELELVDGRFLERDYIPTYLNHEYSGHLWKYRDITQSKLAEVSLKEALVKSEASNRLKTAFMNNISHEVRTPLNGIMGFGSLLADPHLTSEERQQYNQFLKASGNRLINTITDYMDISLIASKNIEVSLNPVNVRDLLKELQAKFQDSCTIKKLALNLTIPREQEHFTLNTDTELLRKIIACLLDNAIKFTSLGSITFGYSVKSGTIDFFVIDTGIGVASDAQERIFEPFMQEDITDTRGHEGSGLGLSIIKGFLKLLGSEIRLESVKGHGASFFFSLPMEPGITEENEPIDPPVLHAEIIRPVVLVAEDDLLTMMYIEVILKQKASFMYKAVNGQEAVDLCRAHPEISMVLMDIKMPVMNGFEATREIRRFNKEMVIIAQTAYAHAGIREEALTAGCNDYISKPIDEDELLRLIHKYFSV